MGHGNGGVKPGNGDGKAESGELSPAIDSDRGKNYGGLDLIGISAPALCATRAENFLSSDHPAANAVKISPRARTVRRSPGRGALPGV